MLTFYKWKGFILNWASQTKYDENTLKFPLNSTHSDCEMLSITFPVQTSPQSSTISKSTGFLLHGLEDFSTELVKYLLSFSCSLLAHTPVDLIWTYYLNDNIVLSIYLIFGLFSHLMKPCLILRQCWFEYYQYRWTVNIGPEQRKGKAAGIVQLRLLVSAWT